MDSKEFLKRLDQIRDPGRLANLKRIFGKGGSEVGGLKILAQLGVPVSDPVACLPYKVVAHLHGRGIGVAQTGNMASILHRAAMVREDGKNDRGELSFDRRFDALVASRDCARLTGHLLKVLPFLDDYSVDFDILLKDLIEWSSVVRDRWIETYYQA